MSEPTPALNLADAEPFEPGELQDGLLMHIENVHERLAEARAAHRVMPGNPFAETATPAAPTVLGVTALGYAECAAVLSDPSTYCSSLYADIVGSVMGRTMLEMDGPEHRAYRLLATPAFRQRMLERWRTELVEVVVDELIGSFAGRGSAELAREFTFAFPVQVIARLLGLPRQDYVRFQRLSIELLNVVYDWNRGMAASGALREYFGAILAERRREPQDDLITNLAEAEIDGQRLSDDEIFAFLLLMLPAGVETTYRSSGNLLVALLSAPRVLEEVRDDLALLPRAIEEALRWEPPITTLVRHAVRDSELGGVHIPAGTNVSVSIAAANRDPERYADPDHFDIHREDISHLTFGHGPHICLGMHLARMESTVAIGALLQRLPDLRLDASAPPPQITGVAFRSPAAIPVTFTPR
jgi:cytochrome P450